MLDAHWPAGGAGRGGGEGLPRSALRWRRPEGAEGAEGAVGPVSGSRAAGTRLTAGGEDRWVSAGCGRRKK